MRKLSGGDAGLRLLISMLSLSPSDRPSMQALLSEPHPIFRSMVDDCGDDDDDSGLFSSSFAYYRGNSVDKLEKF